MSADLNNSLLPYQPDFEFIRTFTQKANVAFWVAEPATYQLVYVSPHADRLLQLPTDHWLDPLFWQTHLYEADRDRVLTIFETAVRNHTVEHFEYRMVATDGRLIWFRDRICLVEIAGRSFLCGMMTDVTAYKTGVDYHNGIRGYTSIFLEIVTLLSGNEDIKQKLEQLAEKLCHIFDLAAVSILHWSSEWDSVANLAFYSQTSGVSLEAIYGEHHLSELVDGLGWWDGQAESVVSNDDDVALSEWEQTRLHLHDAKTILYIPIFVQGSIIGCLELITREASRQFAENDIELGKFVAQQTATAIVRAQLFKAEARRRREAEILLDVAEFVSSSLDRDEILIRVMEIIRVYLDDVHNCSISLITEDGLQLETILSWYAQEEYMISPTGTRVSIGDTFAGQLAITGGDPVIISDLAKIPFANKFTTEMMNEGLRAILCVPLNIKNRPVGTLDIHHWHAPRQFSSEEIALLQGVANQAAIAIENAQLFANERRQLNLSRTLQKVGALLTTSLHLEEVYEHIFDLLGQVTAYGSASLFLFEKANDHFALASSRGLDLTGMDPNDLALPASLVFDQIDVLPGWTVAEDVSAQDYWVSFSVQPPVRAWIGAFLIVKGEINGILSVDGSRPGQYSDEDGRMVAAFANQAAIAIENARLYDETMRQAKELAILNQVSQESAVSLNIDEFLEHVAEMVGAELFPHIFGFVMYNAATDELRPHASYTPVVEKLQQNVIPLDKSIIGQVIFTGRPYYAPNVKEDPYYFETITNVLSEVVIPLKLNQEVVGVIDAASPEPDAFSSRDINFLVTLAGNIAAVMERASLYDTLRIQADGLAEEVAQRTSELKLERDRLFAILESAGEGILLTDTEAHIMYANPAMERQSGYTRDELKEKNPRVLGSEQMPQAVFTDMWHRLLQHESWAGELINQHKEGHVYDVAVTVTPIVDMVGEVTGYVSVQSDISRLKELERLKTEFIANVSHQLRTPLTNIKTYVSLLNKGKPEKFPRYFSVLHHEIDRLARLIQDLLDISRLDAEKAPNPDAATDFCDWWATFWSPFKERAERENRVLRISLPSEIVEQRPIVSMEPYQLEKILSRLVENGLAYAGEGGIIEVAVLPPDPARNSLPIEVRDNGPGIPEAERPFIFDRFFRGAQAVESGLLGNGLGLAIVKELLTLYGGEISLVSDLNEGSCFTLYLPLVTASGEETAAHDNS